jgi:hypothetical protein
MSLHACSVNCVAMLVLMTALLATPLPSLLLLSYHIDIWAITLVKSTWTWSTCNSWTAVRPLFSWAVVAARSRWKDVLAPVAQRSPTPLALGR